MENIITSLTSSTFSFSLLIFIIYLILDQVLALKVDYKIIWNKYINLTLCLIALASDVYPEYDLHFERCIRLFSIISFNKIQS